MKNLNKKDCSQNAQAYLSDEEVSESSIDLGVSDVDHVLVDEKVDLKHF